MLLTKTVMTTWQRPTCTHYKKLGYKFTKIYDEFEVKIEDLLEGSHARIECLCDYCLEEGKETVVSKEYREYVNSRKTLEKDCCNDCKFKKEKEVTKELYGVESALSLPSIREKIRLTNNEKYGCDNVFQNEDIKLKIKQSNFKKYGVEYYTQTEECQLKIVETTQKRYGVDRYTQTDECKERTRNTNLRKFGVNHYSQTEEYKQRVIETSLTKYGTEYYVQTEEYKQRAIETNLANWGFPYPNQSPIVKEKTRQTNLRVWGVEHPMQNKEFLEKQKILVAKAMKEKGTVNYSMQQEHICNIVGGELNYLIDHVFLDIAFPNDKIYIEYNGSGHDIQVRIGKITSEQFRSKELKRYFFLKSLGWKQIEINSSRDYLPDDETIINLIIKSIGLINNGHNWVKIDIDNKTLTTKLFSETLHIDNLKKLSI